MAKVCKRSNEYNLVESHCKHALSKRYDREVEDKTSLFCYALGAYGDLQLMQGNHTEAKETIRILQSFSALLIRKLSQLHTSELVDVERQLLEA